VRRAGGDDEAHLVEPALFPALLGKDQVRDVDGVEGSAEYAQTHGRSYPEFFTAENAESAERKPPTRYADMQRRSAPNSESEFFPKLFLAILVFFYSLRSLRSLR
jgi:hypothetical protein